MVNSLQNLRTKRFSHVMFPRLPHLEKYHKCQDHTLVLALLPHLGMINDQKLDFVCFFLSLTSKLNSCNRSNHQINYDLTSSFTISYQRDVYSKSTVNFVPINYDGKFSKVNTIASNSCSITV